MSISRIIYVTGNENKLYQNILMENLLYQIKNNSNEILMIYSGANCFSINPTKMDTKEKNIKSINYYTTKNISGIPLEKILLDVKNKKQILQYINEEKKYSDIFIYGDNINSNLYLLKYIDSILLILKNDDCSLSYLYNLMKFLNDNNINKKINIVISKEKLIENSIAFFLKIKKEMTSLLNFEINLTYAGFVFYEEEFFSIFMNKNKLMIEIYNEGYFHGMLKFIIDKINENERTIKDQSFFESLSNIDLETIENF